MNTDSFSVLVKTENIYQYIAIDVEKGYYKKKIKKNIMIKKPIFQIFKKGKKQRSLRLTQSE